MSILLHQLPKNNFKGQKNLLKSWIKTILQTEKKMEGKISFTFCSDEQLLDINKEFLNHNTLTDIITFDYNIGLKISGEIYISIERVSDNAVKFKQVLTQELLRVMAHGVLHLCGYGDKKKEEKIKMRQKESFYVLKAKKIGLS